MKNRPPRIRQILQTGILCLVFAFMFYCTTILWRVSVAEYRYFGQSRLIPLVYSPPYFTHPPIVSRLNKDTFTIRRNGKLIAVDPQMVNAFQHTLGSALVSFELGPRASTWLFCGNEWYDSRDLNEIDYRDRHKDLYNNRIGRSYAYAARRAGKTGRAAEDYLIGQILTDMEFRHHILLNTEDPKIYAIPSEAALGCPYLPTLGRLIRTTRHS